MPNEEHLEILKQGKDAWNQWRTENPHIQPDLSGADLRGADLKGADLTEAYCSIADFREADLRGAHLGKRISGTRFSGKQFFPVQISRVRISTKRISMRQNFVKLTLRRQNWSRLFSITLTLQTALFMAFPLGG